jgi:hypothetical protein
MMEFLFTISNRGDCRMPKAFGPLEGLVDESLVPLIKLSGEQSRTRLLGTKILRYLSEMVNLHDLADG